MLHSILPFRSVTRTYRGHQVQRSHSHPRHWCHRGQRSHRSPNSTPSKPPSPLKPSKPSKPPSTLIEATIDAIEAIVAICAIEVAPTSDAFRINCFSKTAKAETTVTDVAQVGTQSYESRRQFQSRHHRIPNPGHRNQRRLRSEQG